MKSLIICLLFCVTFESVAARELVITRSDEAFSDMAAMILSEAYERLGEDMRFEIVPAKRSLGNVSAGLFDGELIRGQVSDVLELYPDLVQVAVPVLSISWCMFSKTTEISVQQLENYSLSVAYQRGLMFPSKLIKARETVEIGRHTQSLVMLDLGRVEAAVVPCDAGEAIIAKRKLSTIKRIGPVLSNHPLYHFVHPKHADLAKRLKPVLQGMHETGRIRALRNKFFESFLSETAE